MTKYSSNPYKTERMTLAGWVDGPFSRTLATDECDVSWLAESEAQILWFLNGHRIDAHGCFNDYYGFGDSLRGAAHDAGEWAERHGLIIGEPCAFSLRIEVTVSERPMRLVKAGSKGWKGEFETMSDRLYFGTPEVFEQIRRFDYKTPRPEDAWVPGDNLLVAKERFKDIVWASDGTDVSAAHAVYESVLEGLRG